ncbi:MAG: type III-A CRISPR-associated RAMP protein Csm3 [Dehalococcoidia bacterium]
MMEIIKIELLGHRKITGSIECQTGLRIGGGGETIEIGGLDNPIIKHPITQIPYIPGSSLKGKMRSLLELNYGLVEPDGSVHKYRGDECFRCQVCRIFGVSAGEGSPFGPGRLIVRDCQLQTLPEEKDLTKTEIKWENVINRIKGSAEHPRQMERVPAGATFSFEMSYRVFNVVTKDRNQEQPDGGEVDKSLFPYVLQALRLVERDTLGGSGSRGYGKVKFSHVTWFDLDGREESVDIDQVKVEEIKLEAP